MKVSDLPIAFTMGDPSGIGPEVIVKTFSDLQKHEKLIFVANSLIIQNAIKMLDLDFSINVIKNAGDALFKKNIIDLIEVADFTSVPDYGEINSQNGKASFDAIIKSYELASKKNIAGFVTAPINKSSFNLANINFPGHTEILAEKSGNKEQAIKLYKLVLEKSPSNNTARKQLLSLQKANLSTLEPSSSEAEFGLLVNLYNQGKYNDVVIGSIEMTKSHPKNFKVWNLLGSAYNSLNDNQRASTAFREVIKLDPHYSDGYNNLGVTLKNQGRHREAIKNFKKALKLNKSYVEAYYNLGNTFSELRQFSDAISSYEKVISLHPNHVRTFNNWGIVLNETGRSGEAIKIFEQAISILKRSTIDLKNQLRDIAWMFKSFISGNNDVNLYYFSRWFEKDFPTNALPSIEFLFITILIIIFSSKNFLVEFQLLISSLFQI